MNSSLNQIPVEVVAGEIDIRGDKWGDQSVRFVQLPAGADMTPLLKGLPDDLCACPHYGYVLEGSMTIRFADGSEETTTAGEAFYWRGGHTGWTTTGAKFLEFSPAAEIAPVLAHLAPQLQPSA